MFARREDIGGIVFGAGVFLEVWIGAEDGGAAGDDGAACVEANSDERETIRVHANVDYVDSKNKDGEEGKGKEGLRG